MWEVTNNAGFTLSPNTYLTFGLLPTNSKHSYLVQFYSTNGQPIGTAIDPSSYTYRDWGPTGGEWTIYCIPSTAFSSLPTTVGGLSIQDTSGLSTNTIYISAPGFFNEWPPATNSNKFVFNLTSLVHYGFGREFSHVSRPSHASKSVRDDFGPPPASYRGPHRQVFVCGARRYPLPSPHAAEMVQFFNT